MKRTLMLAAGGLALALGLTPLTLAPRAWADDVNQKSGKKADADEAKLPEAGQPVQAGDKAPDLALTSLDGKQYKLSDLKGKQVVLEWFDADSPFVAKQHKGAERAIRNEFPDLVWLAIASGESANVERLHDAVTVWKVDFPVLLDPTGGVAKRYGVTKAPAVFVIDEEGVVRYEGAMTDDASADTVGESYVRRALRSLKAGEKIDPASTFVYGSRLTLPDLD